MCESRARVRETESREQRYIGERDRIERYRRYTGERYIGEIYRKEIWRK